MEATNFILGLSTTIPDAETVTAITTAGDSQPATVVAAAAAFGPPSPGQLMVSMEATAPSGGKTSPLQARKQQLMAEKSDGTNRPRRPSARPAGHRSSEDAALNNPFAEAVKAPVPVLVDPPEPKARGGAGQAVAAAPAVGAQDKAARPPKPPAPSMATLAAVGKAPPMKPTPPPTTAPSRRNSRRNSGEIKMGADIASCKDVGNATVGAVPRRRGPAGRRRSSTSAPPIRPPPSKVAPPSASEATSPAVAMLSVGAGPLTIDGVDLPDMMYHNFEVVVATDAESEPKPDPVTLAAARPISEHVVDGPMTVDGIDLPDMMYHNFDPPKELEIPHEVPPPAAASDASSEGYVRPLELVGEPLPPGPPTGETPDLPVGGESDIGSECEFFCFFLGGGHPFHHESAPVIHPRPPALLYAKAQRTRVRFCTCLLTT